MKKYGIIDKIFTHEMTTHRPVMAKMSKYSIHNIKINSQKSR